MKNIKSKCGTCEIVWSQSKKAWAGLANYPRGAKKEKGLAKRFIADESVARALVQRWAMAVKPHTVAS